MTSAILVNWLSTVTSAILVNFSLQSKVDALLTFPRGPSERGGGKKKKTQDLTADPDYWKGEVFAYVGLPQNLKDLKGFSGSRVRSGEVFACVGRN